MGENSNRCLNNNRRVVENIQRYSAKYDKGDMWYKNRIWAQKTNKFVECKHKRTSKNKQAKMERILAKKEQRRVI